jgi:hypothetical protein
MIEIAMTSAEDMKKAPRITTVGRVDDIAAAKNLILNWKTIPKE